MKLKATATAGLFALSLGVFAAEQTFRCQRTEGEHPMPLRMEIGLEEEKLGFLDGLSDNEYYDYLKRDQDFITDGLVAYKGVDSVYGLKYRMTLESKMLEGKAGRLEFRRQYKDGSVKLQAKYSCRL